MITDLYYYEAPGLLPYRNQALEEYLLRVVQPGELILYLWQNQRTVVIGRNQNSWKECRVELLQQDHGYLARRLSGGGAVFHDLGNLNFTFIVDQADNADFNFNVFVVPVLRALERFGVTAAFNGRNDLTIDGQKFSGNSQYARHGRLLHHGCIMLDSNLTNVADALKVKQAKFDSKSVKSVRSRVTTINAHAPRPISMEEFKAALRAGILESDGLEPRTLTPEELAAVKRLRDEKYATWEWNYGRSPAYHMRRERKFSAGLVTIFLQAEEGRIKSIRFYGDFFGNGDLAELEEAMVSLKLDQHLEKALENCRIGEYLNGITAHDIAQMLLY